MEESKSKTKHRLEILEKALEKLVLLVREQDKKIDTLSSELACLRIEVNAPHDLNDYMQEHKNDMSMETALTKQEIQDGMDRYYGN